MPEEENVPDSEESQGQPKKKKGGLKRLLVVGLLLVVIGAGGAGGFYYWRHRSAAKATVAATKGTDKKPAHGQATEVAEDTSVKEVIELQPFIVNLADRNETRYLRMTISLGVGDTGEGKADPIFTTRVRNAILAIITTKTSEQVLTVEGKAELRKEMLSAARSAVDKPEVHAIYITDFIVQM